MRTKMYAALMFLLVSLAATANAQTSAFTYQGRLTDATLPASGTYQMQFSIFDAASGGAQIGTTITNSSVAVANGVFTVNLDFSPATPFASGANRWIEIAVKKPADPGYTTLTPRQPVTSSPFSTKASSSTTADSVSAACILCITDAHISGINGAKVTDKVADAINSGQLGGQPGTFYRNAANLNSGTIDNSRTTGTSANTADTLVLRDGSGGFSANSITLPAVTRYYSVPPSSFVPRLNTFTYAIGTYAAGTTPGQLVDFSAPVHLPHGATITAVRFYPYDNDTVENISIQLYFKPHVGSTITQLASGGTTGFSPFDQSIPVTLTGGAHVVDNASNFYSLNVSYRVPASFFNITFNSVRISYTVTSPLP